MKLIHVSLSMFHGSAAEFFFKRSIIAAEMQLPYLKNTSSGFPCLSQPLIFLDT